MKQIKYFIKYLNHVIDNSFVHTKLINDKDISSPIVDAVKKLKKSVDGGKKDAQKMIKPIEERLNEIVHEAKKEKKDEITISINDLKGKDGKDGEDGKDGKDGEDGYSPIKFVDYFTKKEQKSFIKQIQKQIKIPKNGADGETPRAGIDYPSYDQVEVLVKTLVLEVPKPKDGFTPDHQWDKEKTKIRFQKPNGKWGKWSSILKGANGQAVRAGWYNQAKDVSLDTSNFDRNLSDSDDNVQKAFETLDELITSGGLHADLTDIDTSGHDADIIALDTSNFDNNLSSADDTVQKALDTLDDHTHTESDITDLDHTDDYAIHDNVPYEIGAITRKLDIDANDRVLIEDSADSWNKKQVRADLLTLDETAIHKNVAGEIITISNKDVVHDLDFLLLEDYEDGYNKKRSRIQNLPFYGNGTVIMNTNPFGGKKLYISTVDNAFFKASTRWIATGKFYNKSDDSYVSDISSIALNKLFDGNYESYVEVPAGQYLVINVSFSDTPTAHFPGYPYGSFYLSHYHIYKTESIGVRAYCDYAPQGIGWKDLLVRDFVNNGTNNYIMTAYNGYYYIKEFEFTFTADDTDIARINQIDLSLSRPSTVNEMPLFDKYKENNIYEAMNFKNSSNDTTITLNDTGTITSLALFTNSFNTGTFVANSSSIFTSYLYARSKVFLGSSEQPVNGAKDVYFFSDGSNNYAQPGNYYSRLRIFGGGGQTRRLDIFQEYDGDAIISATKTDLRFRTSGSNTNIRHDMGTGNAGFNVVAPTERVHIEGNLFLNSDSDKVLLGAGKDMSISYDGTDGLIKTNEGSPSDLKIETGAKTEFDGEIKVGDNGTTAEAGMIRYNSTTNKHQGYDGTTWNDLY